MSYETWRKSEQEDELFKTAWWISQRVWVWLLMRFSRFFLIITCHSRLTARGGSETVSMLHRIKNNKLAFLPPLPPPQSALEPRSSREIIKCNLSHVATPREHFAGFNFRSASGSNLIFIDGVTSEQIIGCAMLVQLPLYVEKEIECFRQKEIPSLQPS